MEIESDRKSEFLKQLEAIDGRHVLFHMENLLALEKYNRQQDSAKEMARQLMKIWIGRLQESKTTLDPVDFDDVKHYSYAYLSKFIDVKPAEIVGTCAFGRFLKGKIEQGSCTRFVTIRSWDLKFPAPHYTHDMMKHHPARLHNEIVLWRDVLKEKSHPLVAKLIGYSVDKKLAAVYDVNPFKTLRDEIPSGWLGWDGRLKFATQVAELLLHFHGFDIIVGSIDSRNLLIDMEQNIKLCGFGPTVCMPTIANWAYSQSAPEVRSGTWTTKMDIYAFGILLLELMTKKPFREVFIPMWSEALRDEGEKSILAESISDDKRNGSIITDLAMKCLEVDPGKRCDAGFALQKLKDLNEGRASKKSKVDE